MVAINLLPWREYTKSYQLKQIKIIFLSAVVLTSMMIIAGLVVVLKWQDISNIRIAMLTKEFNHYQESRLTRTKVQGPALTVLASQSISQDFSIGRLFTALGTKPHAEVCFTEIIRDNNTILFTGKTRSAADLTEYLRYWSAAYLFTEIRIKRLDQQQDGLTRFSFQAQEYHLSKNFLRDE